MKENVFMQSLLNKRMKNLLEKVPIFIVKENIALAGVEEAALRLI